MCLVSTGVTMFNANAIPVVGWILDFVLKISLAIPFWFIWTRCGLGEKFFYFLPKIYQTPGFWETVGLFIAVPILNLIFMPKIVSVRQTNKVTVDEKEEEKEEF